MSVIRTLASGASSCAMALSLAVAGAAGLALPITAMAQDVPAQVGEIFPEIADSDLPFDTEYRVGRLDNGMRYIIRPNATPPEQGLVQMWVDLGSVAEGDAELGYAHFVEHMAFNGSTNLPEGEMVRLLEREGLAFGADTNASTGFDRTLYRLDLPRNDMELLGTALMLMRETASELTFDDAAVDREKGVILSERRVRDTYQLRAQRDYFDFVYPGSRLSQRFPIGMIETIENATGASLRSLYDRYYRPENTVLIVVGDYDPAAVEAAIMERFGDWQGESALEPMVFGPVDPALAGQTDIYLDPALSEGISVIRNGAYIDRPDSLAERQDSLLRRVAYAIINRRMQRLSRLDDPPFRGASFGTGNVFEEGRTTTLSIGAIEGEWARGLAAAQEEYRRALAFGFSESEIAEQVANIRRGLEAEAAGAETRANGSFVAGAIALLRDGNVPTDPQSALERFDAFEAQITPDAVIAALRADAIALDDPLIRFVGRTGPEGGEAALRSAWNTGMRAEVTAPDLTEVAEFAYTDFGEPGTVVSDEVDERLGIRMVRFANGVMLNLKRTELDLDSVLVQLAIDGGDMLQTADNPLATAMVSRIPTGGLGAHTLDELQSVLAGRRAALSISSGAETFNMGARTTPGDLELQMQLMAAAIVDPAFRTSGDAQYRQSVENWFATHYATPGSALGSSRGAIISDNDPRFSRQPMEAYLALSLADQREVIWDRWQNGAMELGVVGDIDEEATIAMVARTFGALPQRETAFRAYEEGRQRSFTDNREARTVYHDGEADQAIIRFEWPTTDDSDPLRDLELDLLQRVVRIKMIDVLREELGETYSPSVGGNQSSVFDGYGTFAVSAEIDTARLDGTREAMLGALAALIAEPVDEDVVLRARQPMLESYDNALDSNGSWLGLAARAQTEDERIDRFLAARERLEAITPERLQTLAQTYLDPAERLEVMVLPRPESDGSE